MLSNTVKDDHSESLKKQRAVLFNVYTTRGVSEKTMHIAQAHVINVPSFTDSRHPQ